MFLWSLLSRGLNYSCAGFSLICQHHLLIQAELHPIVVSCGLKVKLTLNALFTEYTTLVLLKSKFRWDVNFCTKSSESSA